MWLYRDEEFTSDDIKHWKAFVYQITNLTNDKKYIGKKLFFKTRRKPPLKGKTRKRVEITESDWQDYWGSNEALKADVDALGKENFKREIIYLCNTKGEASYHEAALQFEREVLLREDYYNGIINCRINASHLPKAADLSKEKS
jgi:hypothetical protein